jgi:hypothetical protein
MKIQGLQASLSTYLDLGLVDVVRLLQVSTKFRVTETNWTYQSADDNLAGLWLTSRASSSLDGRFDRLDRFLDTTDGSILDGFAAALLTLLLLLAIDDGIEGLI